MNKDILNKENQDFINLNIATDTNRLLLSKATRVISELTELINQIETKKKCKDKLPTWFNTKNIYYPDKVNIEQASSEIAATYKAELVAGNVLVDITSGFGVDDYYFSRKFQKVIGCEINKELAEISKHNHQTLGAENVEIINTDGLVFLKDYPEEVDLIYLDPSRRHGAKGKIFRFEESEPNVVEILDSLFLKSDSILIKSSPLVDLTAGLRTLEAVAEIHIVAVANEVKELLWLLKKDYRDPVLIKTIDLYPAKTDAFQFYLVEEASANVEESEPLTYLYEPNSSILKSGSFKLIAQRFNLSKLHQHSHLYTSIVLIDFPGRIFKILNTQAYNKKLLKKSLPMKANVTTRNFPKSVAQIRKELKITDGGKDYLFFTTNLKNDKIVIVCERL